MENAVVERSSTWGGSCAWRLENWITILHDPGSLSRNGGVLAVLFTGWERLEGLHTINRGPPPGRRGMASSVVRHRRQVAKRRRKKKENNGL
jgi:hypothetical protein